MRSIAIDGNVCLYQFLYKIRTGKGFLTNNKGEITSHLSGFLFRAINIFERQIIPVFVFDGPRHERKLRRGKPNQLKIETRKARLANVKTMLKYMGIQVIDAPHDGEAQCAWMTANKIVNEMTTSDIDDSFMYGAERIICTYNQERNKYETYNGTNPRSFSLTTWLMDRNLPNFTRVQYVTYKVIKGTDYNVRVEEYKGMRQKKLHALILENKIKLPDDAIIAKDIFMSTPHVNCNPAAKKKMKKEKLMNFLIKEQNFNEKRIKNAVVRLSKAKAKISRDLFSFV